MIIIILICTDNIKPFFDKDIPDLNKMPSETCSDGIFVQTRQDFKLSGEFRLSFTLLAQETDVVRAVSIYSRPEAAEALRMGLTLSIQFQHTAA